MEQKQKVLINVLYYSIIVVGIYALIRFALPVFMPFLIALIVVLLIRGLSRRAAGCLHAPERAVRLIFLAIFYLALFGLFLLFGAKAISGSTNFVTHLPEFYQNTVLPMIEQISDWIESVAAQFDPSFVEVVQNAFTQISTTLSNNVADFSATALSWASSFLTNIPSMILNVVLTVVSSFYLAADFEKISAYCREHLPEKWLTVIRNVRQTLHSTFGIYLRSYTLIFLMTWGELFLGFFLLGVPHLPLVSLLVALCDILPILGTGTVLIPWAIIAALLGYYPMAVGVGILYLVITIIRNTVEPKLVGKQIGLHPLLTLISMVVGLSLFGIIGLFGLPVTLSILIRMHETRQKSEPALHTELQETP